MIPGRRHLGHAELMVQKCAMVSAANQDHIRELTQIIVPEEKRGLGMGTRLMRKVCTEADNNHKFLLVHVKPYASDKTVEDLTRWYTRLGFNKIQEEPEVVMVRKPR
jgi:N-acetylglutamate synthase-like GNAT family acetyltransferase